MPEGIIFQSQNSYKDLRKMMIEEKYLWAVVSLPSGIFQPYSGVKTSILFFDKEIAKKNDSILFLKVENDGFDLGAQRRAGIKNDLPEAVNWLKQHKEMEIAEGFKKVLLSETPNSMVNLVKKEDIAKSGDYNLSGERYRDTIIYTNRKWPMVKLGEICEINPKKSELANLSLDTEVSFVPMADLSENSTAFESKTTKKLSDLGNSYTYFRDGDVLLAKVSPCFENGKLGIANNLINGVGFGSSEFTIIRPSEKILKELVYYYLRSESFKQRAKLQMTGTGGLQRVPTNFVKNYQIPLPPLSVQQEIVEKIDQYQKDILDAKKTISLIEEKIKLKVSVIWE